MRIALDVTSMPRQKVGAGYYMYNLVKGLGEVPSGYQYLVFAPRDDLATLCLPNGQLVLDGLGTGSRVGRLVWEQTALPAYLERNRIALLHSTHYTLPVAGSFRRIVTFHDMTFFLYPQMHTPFKRFFFRAMIFVSCRRANAIIADSNSTREDILRLLKLDPSHVFAVPLGVADHFLPMPDRSPVEAVRRKHHLPDSFILYVGVLEPRKNLPRLVQAFKEFVDHGLPHSLVLVGRKGWMYQELFRSVQKLGLGDRVIFTGYVPEEELPPLYNAADLFVYPSLYEGFGLPVLEAMACGVPVVTSNVSSMPEIVGDAGRLIDPHRVDELSRAMLQIITDRSLHDDLAIRARERSKLFPWRRTAQETLAVYEHVAPSQ